MWSKNENFLILLIIKRKNIYFSQDLKKNKSLENNATGNVTKCEVEINKLNINVFNIFWQQKIYC